MGKITRLGALLALALCLFLALGYLETQLNTASASTAEIKAIVKRGKLIVAVKDNLRPLAFRDASGNLQGLEIDIARRFATEWLGKPDAVEFKPVVNQERLAVVLKGKVDMTIARVTATENRGRIVHFSIPYYIDGTSFVTKDKSLQRLEEVGKKPLAVLNNSDTIAHVKYFLPNAKLIGVSSYEEGRSLLEKGKAAAFAADASVLAGWVQEYPDYHILPLMLSAEPLCVVVPKGLQHKELQLRLNEALARWQDEGWLQERIQYWGLPLAQK